MTLTARVTMVRIGEQAATSTEGDVLSSVGLGSCIGLAHILLPDSRAGAGSAVVKFADTAVPALIERMIRLGAVKRSVVAVLVGGAQMFSFGAKSTLDIGSRNEEATRSALKGEGIPVRAATTGGNKGRTITVYASERAATAKEAGGLEIPLFGKAA